MPTASPKRDRRPALTVVAAILAVGVVLLVLAFLFRPTINVTLFKQPIENILSEVIEGPVTLEKVTFRPGTSIDLGLYGLTIDSTGADVTVDFATIKQAQARLEILPLLRRELRLNQLTGNGIELRLQRDRRDRGNWPVWKAFVWDITRLEGIDVRDIGIHYLEASTGREIEAKIDDLTGGISTEDPLSLEITGSAEDVPFTFHAAGGTLGELDRQEDWPLEASLTSDSLRLEISGLLPAGGADAKEGLSFEFAISGSNLAAHPAVVELDLPDLGEVSLTGQVGFAQSSIELAGLEGTFGRSDVSGELRLLTGDALPSLSGRLALGTLDLAPWLEADDNRESESTTAKWSVESLEDVSLASLTEVLQTLDADVSITVANVTGLPFEVADLGLDFGLAGGRLEVPLNVRLAGSALEGRASADTSVDEPKLGLALRADSLRAESLVDLPSDLPVSTIRIGRLDLTAAATGQTGTDLLRSLAIELDGRGVSTSLTLPKGEPLALALSRARLFQAEAGSLTLSTAGALQSRPFTLSLETGNLRSLLDGKIWPFTVDAGGGGAEIDITGTLTADRESPRLEADLVLTGSEIGELTTWLDLPTDAPYPYAVRAGLEWTNGDATVQLDEARLGRSALSGRIEIEETPEGGFLTARLQSPMIDVEEWLRTLGAAADSEEEEEGLALLLDQRILPTGIDLGQGDLDLRIDEISGIDWQLLDVDLPLRFRDGRLEKSPFSFRHDGATFRGAVALDLRGDTPYLGLDLDGERAELERFLEDHEQQTGLEFTARKVHLELSSRGSTLGEILAVGTYAATLDDVELNLDFLAGDEASTAFLDRVTIRETENEPFELVATGRVEELPVTLRLEAETSLDLLKSGTQVPLKIEATSEGAELLVDGTITLPLGSGGNDVRLTLQGDRLDRFSPLLDMDLPALGPYRLKADWSGDPGGERRSNLELGIGRSDLEGRLTLTAGDTRPRFVVELTASTLVLEDLIPPDSSGEKRADDTAEPSDGPGLLEKLDKIVTKELLETLDADVTLRIDELIWDEQTLPALELRALLESGRLEVDFARKTADAEPSRAKLVLSLEDQSVEMSIAARLERLDYGLLDQVLGEDSGLRGYLSVDLDLQSSAASFADILANANGVVAFTDYPTNFDATLLDLWGGQILRGIIPALVGSDAPVINCNVASLVVEDGIATPETLFLDTTGSRVRGKGQIDLGSGKLDLKLKPRPKQRGLINLSTTVRVRGTLMDPAISFAAGGIARTALRVYLWVWTFWRELLLRKPLPADGSDICLDPPPHAFVETEAITAN